MRIIKRKALVDFWERHPPARPGLERWYDLAVRAEWRSFSELRQTFASADQVTVASGSPVIVFNAGGNKYRLIASCHCNAGRLYVLRILTHAAYDSGRWRKEL